MANYTKTTNFTAKDALSTGDPAKLVKGSDFDTEFDALVTAVATKYDDTNVASQAQAQAGTDNTVLMTPLRTEEHQATWAAENAGIIANLQALADPNADRILFWDDSINDAAFLTVSTGLSISGVNLTTNDAAIVHDNLSGFVANEHIDHSAVTITAGVGLSGGGDITTGRTLTLDLNELGTETTMASGDFIAMVDITDNGSQKITLSNFALAIDSVLQHDNLGGFVANEHIDHSSVSITAGTGLSGGGTIASTRTINLDISGLSAMTATPVGTDEFLYNDGGTMKTMSYNEGALPSRNVSASGNFASTDVGEIVYWTGTTGTLTMVSGVGQDDCFIIVVNSGSGNLTLAGSGVTLNSANSNLVLPAGGIACLIRETSTVWFAGGALQA